MSWVAPWGGYPPPADGGGGGATTGLPIIVTGAAQITADYSTAAPGVGFATGDYSARWTSNGDTTYARTMTPEITRAADVPTAEYGEMMSSACRLVATGILTAHGDDSTGWMAESVQAVAPFAEGPWYDAGIAFPDGLEMWDGAMTRWVWSNANQLWNRTTTPDVATLAELAALVPGANEAFADGGDVGPALTVWCAETEITYTWSGVAWYLR